MCLLAGAPRKLDKDSVGVVAWLLGHGQNDSGMSSEGISFRPASARGRKGRE